MEQVTEAFNLGFLAYHFPMNQTPDGLAQMIHENDVRLADSTVLYVDGSLAGVGLVGVRQARGWVAGMGVAPAWRGQGVGAKLLEQLLLRMREIGLQRAQLEALEVNTPAVKLYQRMGFSTLRPLAVYHGPLQADALRTTARRDPFARVRVVAPRLALNHFAEYHAVAPAWQRERDTLLRTRGAVEGVGLWQGAQLRAYLLFSRQSAGFSLLDAGAQAMDADARRDDIVRLLRALVEPAPESIVRAINTPPGDPLGAALDALGCPIAITQREMVRLLV